MDYTRLRDANIINEKYMDSILIEERLIDSVVADIKTELFGEAFDMPASYVQSSSLPFVVKGVLSAADALKCAEIGAQAIIVSHHHGRLPYAVPPMMVLPEIKDALAGKNVKIIVDCGIGSGADVYKALALGADAAAVGRAMLPSLEKEGAPGVEKFLKSVGDELRYIMSFTGFASVSEMDDSCLYYM